jgi:hypothetical protein
VPDAARRHRSEDLPRPAPVHGDDGLRDGTGVLHRRRRSREHLPGGDELRGREPPDLRGRRRLRDGSGVLYVRDGDGQLQHVSGGDDVSGRDESHLRHGRRLLGRPRVLPGRRADVPDAIGVRDARQSSGLLIEHRMSGGVPQLPDRRRRWNGDLSRRHRRRPAGGRGTSCGCGPSCGRRDGGLAAAFLAVRVQGKSRRRLARYARRAPSGGVPRRPRPGKVTPRSSGGQNATV